MVSSPRKTESVCVGFGFFFNVVGVWHVLKLNRKSSVSHFRLSQKLECAKWVGSPS